MTDEMDKYVETLSKDENEWVRAVANLIKLTEENKLQWRASGPPESLKRDPDRQVEVVFNTDYKDRKLRLYVENVKKEPNPLFSVPSLFQKKYPYWEREIVLELGDKTGRAWYPFPDTYAVADLLESVRYKVLKVDDFLDDILTKEETTEK